MEDVDTVDPDLELLGFATVSLDREYVDVGLSEDDEQIPLGGVLQIPAMCRSAFMRASRIGMRPSFLNSDAWAS